MENILSGVSSNFDFAGMEYRDFRDNAPPEGRNEEEERPPASYADATANGDRRGGR